jgi:hypothetical protein
MLIGELMAAEAGAVSILVAIQVSVLFHALAQTFHGAAMADQDGVESAELVRQLFLLLVKPVGRVFRQQAANDISVLEAHGPHDTIEAHGSPPIGGGKSPPFRVIRSVLFPILDYIDLDSQLAKGRGSGIRD